MRARVFKVARSWPRFFTPDETRVFSAVDNEGIKSEMLNTKISPTTSGMHRKRHYNETVNVSAMHR